MYHKEQNYAPALGWCIARMREQDVSDGGIIAPLAYVDKRGESVPSERTLEIVETSRGHLSGDGTLVECELRPGDRVWPHTGHTILRPNALPQDYVLMRLDQICMYARPARKEH